MEHVAIRRIAVDTAIDVLERWSLDLCDERCGFDEMEADKCEVRYMARLIREELAALRTGFTHEDVSRHREEARRAREASVDRVLETDWDGYGGLAAWHDSMAERIEAFLPPK